MLRPPRPPAAPSSPSTRRPARAGGCAARSPSAGCGRPTSATTRPSASSPTGSTGSASRTGCSSSAPSEGDTVLIGDADNAVVFDFKPMVDAGAEMLGRRGEDQRFETSRPAAERRRAIDAAMPTAARARPAPTWPAGSSEPDDADVHDADWGWTEDDPDDAEDAVTARGGRRGRAGRGQGRLLVADHRRRRHRPRPGARAGRRARRRPRARRRGGAGLLRRDRRRAGAARPARAGRATWPRQQAAASVGQGLLVHRYTEEFARHGIVAGPGAAHRRRRDPAQPLPQRLPHLRQAARARRACRSSTRTTPWPPPRSGSATTTGSPPWSPTWCTPTCCVLLSDVDGLYDGNPRAAAQPRCSPRCRGDADLDGVRVGRPARPGVGTGGMQTKVEAARIATGAGIPVVLTAAEHAGRGAGRRAGRHAVPPDRPAAARPGCCGWRTPPSRKGRIVLDAGAVRAVDRAARVAAAGRHHRRRAARSSAGDPVDLVDAGRPRRWPAGWSTTTPTELPGAARPLDPRPGPRARARRTSARSCTATTWCCCRAADRTGRPATSGRRRVSPTGSTRPVRRPSARTERARLGSG